MTSEPAITITRLPHDPRLAGLVIGYWFIEDLAGLQAGSPITTCPFAGAVLSVNVGRPNAMVNGPTVPRVGLLGLHERCLSWRSWGSAGLTHTPTCRQAGCRRRREEKRGAMLAGDVPALSSLLDNDLVCTAPDDTILGKG